MTRESRQDRSERKCKFLGETSDPEGKALCTECGQQFDYSAYEEKNLVWEGPYLELKCPNCGAV